MWLIENGPTFSFTAKISMNPIVVDEPPLIGFITLFQWCIATVIHAVFMVAVRKDRIRFCVTACQGTQGSVVIQVGRHY